MSRHDQITTPPRRGRRRIGARCLRQLDDGGKPASGASRQDKAFEGALKFSKCMREHGIDMPDPQRVGTGGIKLSGGKVNFNDPKMKSAQSACQKYMQIGGGETIDPAKRAKLQEAALKYARCMRGQGVDMPDPKLAGNGGLTFQAGPGPKSDRSSGTASASVPTRRGSRPPTRRATTYWATEGPGASTEQAK